MVENETNRDPAVRAANEPEEAGSAAVRNDASSRATPATDVQAYIGRQLRAVYDDVAKQPIPDRFLALMKQLEAKGAG